MALLDHPSPFHGAYNPPPIVPLILRAPPPPGLSDPEEFYYDPLPDVTCGSFAAACAFFLAHGHQAMMLECPDLDAFTAASPGAVVHPLSTLPTLVLSKGGQLLIDQAAARLTSLVEGIALGDHPTTTVPWLFLNPYSEVPSVSSSSFATVLPSLTNVPILSQPTPPSFCLHGGPPSHLDPNGVNIAPSARYALLRLGGYRLRPMPSLLQQIWSSLASCVGVATHPYVGFFPTEEHPYGGGYYHPASSMGGLCPHTACSLVMGGLYLPSGDIPSIVYGGGPFPTRPGQFPRASASVAPSHGFSGLSLHSSLAHEELQSSSGLDATRSFLGPGHGPRFAPMIPPTPSGLAPPSSYTMKVLKLNPMKDAKAYLDALEIIKFYLRELEFSNGRADGKLIMTTYNLKASRLWEGQLRLAVKDGTLLFLFKNKGDTYNGHGFKMLAALSPFCHPDSIANAFSSLP